MILKVFAVYDVKSECYSQPMYRQTIGLALRDFEHTCSDTTHPFSKNPEDFTLHELGEFDDKNGQFKNLTAPKLIGSALEYKKQ